jgi:hypothetical protein
MQSKEEAIAFAMPKRGRTAVQGVLSEPFHLRCLIARSGQKSIMGTASSP